jgi:hypothetical protein
MATIEAIANPNNPAVSPSAWIIGCSIEAGTIEMNFSVADSGAKGAKPPSLTMNEKIRAMIPDIAPLLKAKEVVALPFFKTQ